MTLHKATFGPRALWVLFAIGICAAVPPMAFFAVLATFLWVLVASIWLVVQRPPEVRLSEPDVNSAHL